MDDLNKLADLIAKAEAIKMVVDDKNGYRIDYVLSEILEQNLFILKMIQKRENEIYNDELSNVQSF